MSNQRDEIIEGNIDAIREGILSLYEGPVPEGELKLVTFEGSAVIALIPQADIDMSHIMRMIITVHWAQERYPWAEFGYTALSNYEY